MSREHRPLFALLLIALLIRVIWISGQRSQVDARLGDQFEYLQIGRNLLAGQGLSFEDVRFSQTVYAYRTPGYPLMVAACRGQVTVIRFAQALIDTSTVLAVYLMARRFLDRRFSLVAGAVVAFNPFLIYFTGLILTETLFTAMLAWGACLLLRGQNYPGLVLLALGVLVRPSSLGLVLILAAAVQWSRGWRTVAVNVAVASFLIFAVLLPWAYRNSRHPQVGSWVWTTTNGGITTYDGFHDRATGASDQAAFIDEHRARVWRLDETERDEWFAQQAHAWIRTNPGRSLQLAAIKIARTWSPVPLSSEYGGNRIYLLAGLIYTVPVYVLILLGLSKPGLPRSAKVFLLLPAIYFTGIHALSVGSLRYRIPAEPPMALVVASGVRALAGNRVLRNDGPPRRKS